MSSYWDEDYFDNGEYNAIIDELKEKIKEDVNQDIKDKIASLEEDRKLLMQVQQENYHLKVECEKIKSAYGKSEKEIKDLTIEKLIDQITSPVYNVNKWGNKIRFKKCNRCDNSRYIHFLTPLDRDTNCCCACSYTFYTYKVNQNLGKQFLRDQKKGIVMFVKNSWDEYESTTTYLNDKTKYIEDCDWDDPKTIEMVTFDQEVAEKYKDYLNEKIKKEAQEWADKYGLEIEE